jgi:hypothetical protein
MYTAGNLLLSDLHSLPLMVKLYHTASLFKHHPPSTFIRQPAQLFTDALGLFLVTMHDRILKQSVKSLDRLYRTCPP